MKSEASYRKEIHCLLASSARKLAIIDTCIMSLSAFIVFCLAKLAQAITLAW